MTGKRDLKKALVDTLELAGIRRSAAQSAEIICGSDADPMENAKVHAKTNETLAELLIKDQLGKCIHVTGGARALTDPFHRQICEAIREEHKHPFQILYHVPASVASDSWDVVRWSLNVWGKKGVPTWREKLLTLKTIGSQSVDMKAFDERSKIQFSVFGDRFVQLQGVHPDNASAKQVWLIRSEEINNQLAELAEKDLSSAKDIDERIFKDFLATVFSNTSRHILHKLMEKGKLERSAVLDDKFIAAVDPAAQNKIEALKIAGFIARDAADAFKITKDGEAFLLAR